jgi:hypothetical protein
VTNQRHNIRSMPAAESELVRAYLAKRPVTRPTTEQRKRSDQKARDTERDSASIRKADAGWSSWGNRSPDLNEAEALAGADDLAASVKPTAEVNWATATLGKGGALIPAKPAKAATIKQPTQPAEAPVGYCYWCHKALDGLKAGAKFCDGTHSKAFRRRAAKIEAANKQFKDYQQSEQAKAEAARILEFYRFAAEEMKDSAARCGIEATFVAAGDTIVAIHDEPLPPIRFRMYARTEDGSILRPVCRTIEMRARGHNYTTDHPDVMALLNSVGGVTDSPERRVTLYQFEIPAYEPGYVGVPAIELRFKSDPGVIGGDSYDSPWSAEDEAHLRLIVRLGEFLRKRENKSPYVRPTYGRKRPDSYLPG